MTYPSMPSQPGEPSPYEQHLAARCRQLEEENLRLRRERETLESDLGRAWQRCADLRAGVSEREALLTEARELLAPWRGHSDAWPSIGPAIITLMDQLRDALQCAEWAETIVQVPSGIAAGVGFRPASS